MTQSTQDDTHTELLKLVTTLITRYDSGEYIDPQINELRKLMACVNMEEIKFDLERT